jgi:hypothetical protein
MNKLELHKQQLVDILSKGKTFALAYHPDADGFCSTKILIQHLIESGVDRKNISFYPINENDRLLSKYQEEDILKRNFDTVIYIDLCNQYPEQFERLRTKVKYIISLDHHYFKEGWETNFDVYINSKFFDELTKPQVHTASKLLNTIFYNTKNDWLEIIGLEGDVAVPSMPGTASAEATQILNMLGLIERCDEHHGITDNRRNDLLNCLIDSENIPSFLNNFRKNMQLKQLYAGVAQDISCNTESLKSLPAQQTCHSHKIFTYQITAKSGYEIIGLILKEFFPFIGYNSTYILHQELQTKGDYQIFLCSSSPLVNCFQIAKERGGGGHTNRSGFGLYQKSLPSMLDEVTNIIKEMTAQGETNYSKA